MYQNDPLKVLTGECRLSYCHLDAPYSSRPGQDPKFSATLLIPKTDVATKAEIDQSMQAAITEGIPKKWEGKRPALIKTPLWDGDGVRDNGEHFGPECKGCWVMTAGSKMKPQVVHISNIHSELAPSDVYSGMYGRVTIRFFPYSNSGNRGIGCGLGNVLKTRDGDPLAAGRSDAEDDFAGLEQSEPPAPYQQQGYVPQAQYPQQYAQPQQSQYPQQYQQPYPGAAAGGRINPITGLPM